MVWRPFRMTEKTKKWIMGGLVIVAMLTFVLMYTGGRGDFFNDMLHFLGVGASGTTVTTLYNSTVTTKELDQLRSRRILAQQAFQAALQTAEGKVQQDLGALQERQKNQGPDAKPDLQLFQDQAKLRTEQNQLQRVGIGLAFQFQNLQKTDDLLDFMVWLHQADKLGIELTAADTDEQIKRITARRASFDDAYAQVSRNPNLRANPDSLQRAMADEFRALIAQQVMLNYDPASRIDDIPFEQRIQLGLFSVPQGSGEKQVPAPVTPYEFWKYYEDQRTSLDVSLLPIPVPQPPTGGTISDQEMKELKALYNRFKNQEPRPDQAQPGFKVPRKIEVAWAGADVNSLYYQQAATRLSDVEQAVTWLASGTTAGQTGIPPALAPYLLPEGGKKVLAIASPNFLAQFNGLREQGGLAQSDQALAGSASATVGAVLGSAATQCSPLAAVVSCRTDVLRQLKDLPAPIAPDGQQRVAFDSTLLLTGTDASSLAAVQAPLTALALWQYDQQTKANLPPPPSAVQGQVLDHVHSILARDVVVGNLKGFQKEMDNRRGKPGEVQAWLPKGLEEFHLKQQAVQEPRDVYDIAAAPGVQPLKDAYLHQQFGAPTGPKADQEFANALFGTEGTYQPQPWPPSRFGGEPSWDKAEEAFLVWKTEDQKAYTPAFEEAKDKVEAAWRLQLARGATDEQARKLQEEAGKTGGDQQRLVQLAAEHKLGLLELNGVAREVPEPFAAATGHRYAAYQFPDTIRYPGKDWLDQLLKLQKPGDTAILEDQPQRTFYVAVLRGRIDPSVTTFADVYKDMAISTSRDQLLETRVRQQRDRYREDFLKQLRVEAGADDQGHYKLDPDFVKSREKRGGGSDEEQ